MLMVLVASLLGVLAVASSTSLLAITHNTFLCLVAGSILGWCGWFRHAQGRAPVIVRIVAYVAIGMLGFGWAGICGNYYQAVATENGKWLIEVVDLPDVQYDKASFKARLLCRPVDGEVTGECSEVASHPFGFPAYVLLSLSKRKLLKQIEYFVPGQVLMAELHFNAKENKGNPGFDRAKWFISERIMGAASIQSFELKSTISSLSINYSRYWLKDKLRFESSIDKSTYSGLALEPIIMALTIGDRSELDDSHWALLRETGTTHLMAISGLHLGLLSGWVFLLVRLLVGRIRILNQNVSPQFIASILALISAAIYGMLVGFPLPTQRAYIMLIFAYVGVMLGRPKMILDALAFALLLILVLQPFAVLSASLWLSFSAIALVFYVIGNRINQLSGKLQPIKTALHLQFCFFVIMAPLSFYFFGGVSTNSFFSNLLAIPVVTAVLLPISVLNVLVALLNPAWVSYLGEFNYWSLDALLCGLQWINQAFLRFHFQSISIWGAILAVIAALMIFYPSGWQVRAAGIGVLVLSFIPTAHKQIAKVELYNTNHIFLAFIGSDNQTFIVDETPGRRWDEQSVLNSRFPEKGTLHSTHWQDAWNYDQWVIDPTNQSAEIESIGLCGLEKLVFADDLKLLGISGLRVFAIDESNMSCLVYFQWQDKNWLFGGSVSKDEQSKFIETGKLVNNLEVLSPIDFVLLQGEYFHGAFLNLFKEATFLLWNKQPLPPAMIERFSSRGLNLVELATQGATSIRLQSDSIQMQSMVSKRFYHVSPQ